MNTQIVCLAVAFAANPGIDELPTIYSPSESLAAAVRGQSPDEPTFEDPNYEEGPTANGQYLTSPPTTYGLPPASPSGNVFSPFTFPPMNTYPGSPAPIGGGFGFGAQGPQPYRFGWSGRIDAGYLSDESASGGRGDFGIFEVDTELRYTTPLLNGWIFGLAPQFNYRAWSGPRVPGLPGSVYRIGGDIELATPANGAWSVQLVFTPSVNSDFKSQTTSNAWNFDGHGILFYRYSHQWLFAFGAGFWDRVQDQVVPYAGVVFTPDNRWEFRILFPESRISYFLGNPCGIGYWVYVNGEYHVESYEIQEQLTQLPEQIQLEDWRILLGIRSDNGFVTSFIQGGWVFARDVRFRNATPDFEISSGFMLQGGIRF